MNLFLNPYALYLICAFILPQAFSLTCYDCQERRPGLSGEWCSNPKKQRCNVSTSICLKYLHKEGKPGFPNHILAKCELRSYYTQNKINACERSVRRRNGALTISETCTCDTDLCNDASMNTAKMMDMETPTANRDQDRGRDIATTSTTTEPPPTEASDHEEGEEEAAEEGEAEPETDEAVESPTPEIKDTDTDELSAEEKASEESTSTSLASVVHGSTIAIVLQFVLFSLIAARW